MFDKVDRKFSRRGKDLNDIATSSATIEEMNEFDSYDKQEEVERNIDEEIFESAAIDSMIQEKDDEIISFKEDDAEVVSEKSDVENTEKDSDIISSKVDDDDDFQDI